MSITSIRFSAIVLFRNYKDFIRSIDFFSYDISLIRLLFYFYKE
nr:MAG TPA: hypothetical protein [Bacteriophage sp.]